MVGNQSGPATIVFARKVKPGQHQRYEDWLNSVSRAGADFNGYLGTIILRPVTEQEEYVAMVQYDTQEHLRRWLESDERHRCLDTLKQIGIESEEISTLAGLEQWVSHTGNLRVAPPAWKMAILILTGLYPLVLLQGLFLRKLLAPLPGEISLLISLSISVSIMVWIVLPLLSKIFARWLRPRTRESVTVSPNPKQT